MTRCWPFPGARAFARVPGMAAERNVANLSGQREAEIAELLDRGDELVAGLEPHLLVYR